MIRVEQYRQFASEHLTRGQDLTHRQLASTESFRSRPPRRPPQKPELVAKGVEKKLHKRLDERDRCRIIMTSYGSMSIFRRQVRTVRQVSDRLRIPWSTVNRVLQQFAAGGKRVESLLKRKKPRHFNCIPDDIKQILLSDAMVEAWAPYSIAERTKLLQSHLQCRISTHTMWRFYKENGVQFRTGQAVYR